MAIGFGIVFAILFQFIGKPFFTLFTYEQDVIVYADQYMRTYVLDCMFASVHFSCSGFFSACGLSSLSFIYNLTSVLLIRIPGTYFASIWFPETLVPMGLAAPLGSLFSDVQCYLFYRYYKRKGRIQ